MKLNLKKMLGIVIVILLIQNILFAQNLNYGIEKKIELPENENICFIRKNDNIVNMVTYERKNSSKYNSIRIKSIEENKITQLKKIHSYYNGSSIINSPDKKFFLVSNRENDNYTKFFLFKSNGDFVLEHKVPTDLEFTNAIYLSNRFHVINSATELNIYDNQGILIRQIKFDEIVNNFDKESLKGVVFNENQIYFAINYIERIEQTGDLSYKCMLYNYDIKNDEGKIAEYFNNFQEIQQIEFDHAKGCLYLILREIYGGFNNQIIRITEHEKNYIFNDDKISKLESFGEYLLVQKYKALELLNYNAETIIKDSVPYHAYGCVIQDHKLYYITYRKDIPIRRGQKIFAHDVKLIIHDLKSNEKNEISLIEKIETLSLFPNDLIVFDNKVIISIYNKLFQINSI